MKIRNKYSFGKTSKERLNTVSKYLVMTAIRAIKSSPVDFGVAWMGGLRLASEQNQIFLNGNSSCDGYNKISYHQKTDSEGKGLALDLVPYIEGIGFDYNAFGRFGIIGMLMLEAFQELQDEGMIPKNIYLHWGGFWKTRNPSSLGWDLAHYELRDKEQIELL